MQDQQIKIIINYIVEWSQIDEPEMYLEGNGLRWFPHLSCRLGIESINQNGSKNSPRQFVTWPMFTHKHNIMKYDRKIG